MNRFFLLIGSALAVFFISSCAPIPDGMVPKDTYGSLAGTLYSHRHLPQRSARHRVRHATDHLLRPWNDLPVAPDTAATASIPTSARTLVSPPGPLDAETDQTTEAPKLGVGLLDGPGRREAAGHQRQTKIIHTLATPNSHAPAAARAAIVWYPLRLAT